MFRLVFAVLFCVIISVQAENFYLVGNDGNKIGPIAAKAGEQIKIEGKSFTYEPADSAKMTEKMKALKIAKFWVVEADLNDVLELVRAKALKADKLEKKGVNIIYFPKAAYDMKMGRSLRKRAPQIDLKLSNTNLYDIVNSVAKLAQLKVCIGDHGVELHQQ